MNAETRKRGARSESAREKEQEQEGSNDHGYACCSVPPWMGDDMCARAALAVNSIVLDNRLESQRVRFLAPLQGGRERET